MIRWHGRSSKEAVRMVERRGDEWLGSSLVGKVLHGLNERCGA
jgi:hypothetical protein